ncbi:hypothetical protein, partial [Vibrio parahaemolyticus]|uniref:hypothetical protein n=1 Tax=Vibrio parahaemolyticus TaxID=670 RepID=UPI001BAF4C2B
SSSAFRDLGSALNLSWTLSDELIVLWLVDSIPFLVECFLSSLIWTSATQRFSRLVVFEGAASFFAAL